MKIFLTTLVLLSASFTTAADLRVEFREGAPKDRFVVKNIGECALNAFSVTIDLKNSAGKLIFDVTDQGAGVEVFQPFEVVTGFDFLATQPRVTDGQTEVTLKMRSLDPGASLVATTDVDDTIGAREITVKNSEFTGSVITVVTNGQTKTATVGDKPAATIVLESC